MAGTREFTGYPLWIASYTTASRPLMPAWSRWTFWQYSAASRVPGIAGLADMSRFNGTMEDLRKLANLAPAAKTGPAVKVTAKLSVTRTTRNKSVTLRGHVAPVVTGQTVYRQGYYSGAWHTWASTTVARSGSYAFTIKPTKKAVNKYRVFVPATSKRKASVSNTLTLIVR
jgi:hypothetical protein